MNEKQIILQDGIPFVIVASRVYRCAVNAEEVEYIDMVKL